MDEQQNAAAAVTSAAPPVFIEEEAIAIMKESVDLAIQHQPYHHNKVAQWNCNIVEQGMKKMASLNKSYKYIITSTVMQKNGAGLHASSSSYWDASTDGSATYQYDSETMIVIVNTFALAI